MELVRVGGGLQGREGQERRRERLQQRARGGKRERWKEAIAEQPFTVGSTGQPVANPLIAKMSAASREIAELERDFGRRPRSRIGMGISVLEANKSLDRLNAQFREDR